LPSPGREGTAFDEAARFLVDEALASLKQVPRGSIDALTDHIRQTRAVILFGRGRSGAMARAFATRLGHLGFRAFFVGETSTPPVTQDDLVLLVSGSGETFSVTLTAQIASGMGARVVCITATEDSTLAELSDLVIHLTSSKGEDQSRYAPLGTSFEFAVHLLFDAVCAELMARMGETEASLQKRHATLE
jgi:6-phospho-3-hexuloisomerase